MIEGLVSIITPCFNGARFLADTIESVLGQTYAQWEMIIVDDGPRTIRPGLPSAMHPKTGG